MKLAVNFRSDHPYQKICGHCGFKYPGSQFTCTACGHTLVELPSSNCIDCGVALAPDQQLCDACELNRHKNFLRPLVEASVLEDKKLSKAEKAFIIKTAASENIAANITETLLPEILNEFGAVDISDLPVLKIDPLEIRFAAGERHQQFIVENIGGGEMSGSIINEAAYLKVSPVILDRKIKKQVVTIALDAESLPGGPNIRERIRVETDGGSSVIGVQVEFRQAKISLQPSANAATSYATSPLTEPVDIPESQNIAASKQDNGKKAKWIFAALVASVAVIILIILSPTLKRPSPAVSRLDERLRMGQLVTPVGNSAYDLWLEMKSNNGDDKTLSEISSKALPMLTSRGQNLIARWHDDGRATEQDWYELTRLYEWASLINPNDGHLNALKNYCNGQVAFRDKKFDEALELYLKALKSEPQMSLAYNGIGRVHVNKEDYAKAEANYKEAIRCEPQWYYPYLNLGGVYSQTKQYVLAETHFQKAVSLVPNKASIHYQFAKYYESANRFCDAYREYQRALDSARSDPDPGFTPDRVERRVATLQNKCS